MIKVAKYDEHTPRDMASYWVLVALFSPEPDPMLHMLSGVAVCRVI